jgi:hypothetical protein
MNQVVVSFNKCCGTLTFFTVPVLVPVSALYLDHKKAVLKIFCFVLILPFYMPSKLF